VLRIGIFSTAILIIQVTCQRLMQIVYINHQLSHKKSLTRISSFHFCTHILKRLYANIMKNTLRKRLLRLLQPEGIIILVRHASSDSSQEFKKIFGDTVSPNIF